MGQGFTPWPPTVYAETCRLLSAHAGAHRAEARAFAAQPNLAAVDSIGRRHAHRAEARAFAAQPNLANISNAWRGEMNFDGNNRFVLWHHHVNQSPASALKWLVNATSGVCGNGRLLHDG